MVRSNMLKKDHASLAPQIMTGRCKNAILCIKVPSGDPEHGFRSGNYDQGLVFLNQFLKPPYTLYLNPGYILLSDPETTGTDIQGDNMLTVLTGVEWEARDDSGRGRPSSISIHHPWRIPGFPSWIRAVWSWPSDCAMQCQMPLFWNLHFVKT